MKKLRAMDLRSAWVIAVASVAVSMVIAAMAGLTTALPEIALVTGANTGQMTWIMDGYTLALAALLLPAGALGDRLGRREVLIVGLIIFGVASLAAIWCTDPVSMIISRAACGVGAALIMPTTLSLITTGVPADKRELGISIWAAVVGAGAIFGILITGVLLEFFSWKSIFIMFAVMAVTILVLSLTIATSKDPDPGPFDFIGALTSVAAVTMLIFGLIEAPHKGWTSPLVLVCLIGGMGLVVGFYRAEARNLSPLLDVNLFRNRAFAAGSLSVLVQFFLSFGLFVVFLQQVQLIFGYSPLKSAVALMPIVVGVVCVAPLSTILVVRWNALRLFLTAGITAGGIGVLTMGLFDYDEYWMLLIPMMAFAVGLGLSGAPSTAAIMTNTPPGNQGVGSAVNDTARELGAALGIAVSGSIMAAGFDARIGETADRARDQIDALGRQAAAAGNPAATQEASRQADTVAEHVRQSLAEALAVADGLRDQAPGVAATITDGARAAWSVPMGHAYLVVGVVTLVGAAVLCWITPNRIDATAGGAAMADGSATSADQDGDNAEDRHESDRPANVGVTGNTNSPGFSGV
ncbi:MFS transporter [Gordonia sp. (in: high G+C Gram-positive bacteria)]|jgi:MFS family permease|uniref:MFS transporter n=1 Tax=Gordonia sp. (in: high G+C Gram-positive bacteria) TaxID=84139 RepID=UPI001DDD5B79|nr:MFS transporter [Gordonia sp. (in: high G+C Gram-positive bacteria)]MCB1295735.1 MFS transporter [Gordonia sp. (in: high G+C Gram-positive bacteria)]HMS74977.1 MFS transporter [Gordonia sp. (in: high G+C Gram-positive bacteria)]